MKVNRAVRLFVFSMISSGVVSCKSVSPAIYVTETYRNKTAGDDYIELGEVRTERRE